MKTPRRKSDRYAAGGKRGTGSGRPGGEVGYGRPPKANQFKLGQSGNPRGRPKGRKNLATLLDEILYMPIAVNGPGHRRKVPLIYAGLIGAAQRAVKHDLKSLSFLINLARSLEKPDSEGAKTELSADDRKLLEEELTRLAMRKKPQP